MKVCPFCSGEIRDAAVKCKHCKRPIDLNCDKNLAPPPLPQFPALVRYEKVDPLIAQALDLKGTETIHFDVKSATTKDVGVLFPRSAHLVAFDKTLSVVAAHKSGKKFRKDFPMEEVRGFGIDSGFIQSTVTFISGESKEAVSLKFDREDASWSGGIPLEVLEQCRAKIKFLIGGFKGTDIPLSRTERKAAEEAEMQEARKKVLSELNEREVNVFDALSVKQTEISLEDRIEMARRVVAWEQKKSENGEIIPAEPEQVNTEVVLGVIPPVLESFLNADQDLNEKALLTYHGHGVSTICITDRRVSVLVSQKDWEASSSGVGGTILGASSGALAGDAAGIAIGSQFGLTGMLVGGLLGMAAGELVGAGLGYYLSHNDVYNSHLLSFPYSEIRTISPGFRDNGKLLCIQMQTERHSFPIEFIYPQEEEKVGGRVLQFLKKASRIYQKTGVPASQGASQTGSPSGKNIVDKMKDLKQLLDGGLVSQEEFDRKKAEWLSQM